MTSSFFATLIIGLQLFQFGATPAYAEPTELSAEEISTFEAQAKATDIWLRFAKEHPDTQLMSSEKEWEAAVRPAVEEIIETEILETAVSQTELKSVTQRALELIKWQTLYNKMQKIIPAVKTTARLKGLGTAGALSISVSLELGVPIVATALGHIELALISPWMPYHGVALSISAASRKLRVRSLMIKKLGSKDNYRAFMNRQSALRKALKIHSPNDLLFPIASANGKIQAAVISESTIFGRALEKLGLREEHLNFANLLNYCESINEGVEYGRAVKELAGFSRQYKTTLLMSHLFAEGSPAAIDGFNQKFSSGFVEIENLGSVDKFLKFEKWAVELSKVQSSREAMNLLRQVPDDISPVLVGRAWEQIALPSLAAASVELTYHEFRSLTGSFTVLSAVCEQATTPWNEDWYKKFEEYMHVSVNLKCREIISEPVQSGNPFD